MVVGGHVMESHVSFAWGIEKYTFLFGKPHGLQYALPAFSLPLLFSVLVASVTTGRVRVQVLRYLSLFSNLILDFLIQSLPSLSLVLLWRIDNVRVRGLNEESLLPVRGHIHSNHHPLRLYRHQLQPRSPALGSTHPSYAWSVLRFYGF